MRSPRSVRLLVPSFLLAAAAVSVAPSPGHACSRVASAAFLAPAPGEALPTDGVPIVAGLGDPSLYEVVDEATGRALDGLTWERLADDEFSTFWALRRDAGWPAGRTYRLEVNAPGVPTPGDPSTLVIGDAPAWDGGPGPVDAAVAYGASAWIGGVTSCGGNVRRCLPGLPVGVYEVELRAGPAPDAPLARRALLGVRDDQPGSVTLLDTAYDREPFDDGPDCAHVRRRDLVGRLGPARVVCRTEARTCVVEDAVAWEEGACAAACAPPDAPPARDAGVPPAPGPDAGAPGDPGVDDGDLVRYGCDCAVGDAAAVPMRAAAPIALAAALLLARGRRRPRR